MLESKNKFKVIGDFFFNSLAEVKIFDIYTHVRKYMRIQTKNLSITASRSITL